MKKIYFLFLMALLPLFASAEFIPTVQSDNIITEAGIGGSCGENLTWTLNEATKTLTISGTGPMYNYYQDWIDGPSGGPWLHYTDIIKTVIIKSGVTSIGGGAFYCCGALTTITIPNSVESIGSAAFWFCGALTTITIPNSVESIGSEAFWFCRALTTITIPNSVTSIGYKAFSFCNSLTSIKVESGNSVYDSRNNCNAIIHTESNLLINGCNKTTIPNSVKAICDYAFSGCGGLMSITIPTGVIYIGDRAFLGCGLSSIIIPNSVKVVGIEAFCGNNLKDVYCFPENPPGLQIYDEDIFDENVIGNGTLHVPSGALDNYKSTLIWNKFKKIVADGKVKLNKTKATIEKGKTLTLKATIYPTSLPDKSVKWKSSNTSVATVTSSGKVKAVKEGTATITCTSIATGLSTNCKVTVGYVKLDKSKVTIKKGKTVTLKATVYPSSLKDKSVIWKSSNTSVATVTSSGKVKGIKAGTATIICISTATSLSDICEVTVFESKVTLNKTEAYLEKGKTMTLKATLTPTDLSDKSVIWTSSDKSIATVSSSGKVKGVKYGTATITCTSNATGVSATCKVTVGKVVINMSEFTLKKSRSVTLVATVYPTSLTDKSVTWKSSDKSVATVTSSGKVKGIAAGTATITCTSVATGLKGTCTVTVLSTSGGRSIEGDGDDVTGIETIEEAPVATEPYDVYDLSGRKVRHQVTSLDGMPAGIYIVNGKKILKK